MERRENHQADGAPYDLNGLYYNNRTDSVRNRLLKREKYQFVRIAVTVFFIIIHRLTLCPKYVSI